MRIVLLACAVAAFWPNGGLAEEKQRIGEVVFSTPLPSGEELVVVQDPLAAIEEVKTLLSAEHIANEKNLLGNPVGVYPIRLELRRQNQPPLTLWARLVFEPRDEAWRGFGVLAARVEPDVVLLATSEAFEINLWRISLVDGAVSRQILNHADWSLAEAMLSPVKQGVKLKFDRTGHDSKGRLQVTVNEPWPEGGHATVFEQADGSSKFLPTTQKGQKGQTPNP